MIITTTTIITDDDEDEDIDGDDDDDDGLFGKVSSFTPSWPGTPALSASAGLTFSNQIVKHLANGNISCC